ncbi:MAG: alpha/beta fold hydrolase [Nocardia sp.]|uniref:alpha/beta fold hydrolase n=1 Tax=Nocardia sp. TaxID=1821 RepID=UPI00261948D3|nr:alpha/beta hydrolase [Nocardia sp.]MCU1644972.1 alpha/beta fold hydrolase [Nocardia sp.]
MSATLVLLPGLNNTGAVWAEVATRLETNGTVCHTPTLAALPDVDALARQMLEGTSGSLHLVGFSFGGYVALAAAAMAPERTTALSLIGTTPYADTAEERERRLVAARRVNAEPDRYEDLIAAGEATAFHPDSLDDVSLLARRRAMVRAYGPDRFLAHQQAAADRPDRSHVLAGLTARRIPVRFASGADDHVVPLHRQCEAAHRFGAHVHLVPNAGHLVPLEQPDALADWLDKSARISPHAEPDGDNSQ